MRVYNYILLLYIIERFILFILNYINKTKINKTKLKFYVIIYNTQLKK